MLEESSCFEYSEDEPFDSDFEIMFEDDVNSLLDEIYYEEREENGEITGCED